VAQRSQLVVPVPVVVAPPEPAGGPPPLLEPVPDAVLAPPDAKLPPASPATPTTVDPHPTGPARAKNKKSVRRCMASSLTPA
jgi:hypothetical protein